MKTFLASLFLLSASTAFAQGSFESSPLNIELIIDNPNPIQFKPFKLDDFCKTFDANGVCAVRFTPKEIAERAKIDVSFGGQDLYNGTLANLVDKFNEIEAELNKRGVSLRDGLESFQFSRLPVDVERMRKEVMKSIGGLTENLPKVKDPLLGDKCPTLPLEKLDSLPEAVVQASNGKVVKLKAMGAQINQAQRALCSVGYSITDIAKAFDTSDIEAWKNKLLSSDDEKGGIMEQLGLSEYADLFNNLDMEEIKSYGEVAKDVYEIAKKGEFPGPEQIEKLRKDLNVVLPEEYQIPSLPQMDLPTMPVRKDLKVIKKKVWDTLKVGNPQQIAAGASAYVEIRGGEKDQTYTAQGQIYARVLGKTEISFLNANGYAALGAKEAELKVSAMMFGQHLFEPIDEKGGISIKKTGGDSYKPKNLPNYEYPFTIGPVPGYVSIRVDMHLGYEWYVMANNLNITGGVVPHAGGGVVGAAAIGLKNVLSVGVEGQVNLVDLRFPLTGSADVIFLEGRPQLTVQLNSKAKYTLLSGRVAAFAEYPDYKKLFFSTKKDYHTIFQFPGQNGEHSIMSYKLVLGAKGAQVSGQSLDKEDRQEADKLEAEILLDARKEALAKREIEALEAERKSWKVILDDLNSDANKKVSNLSSSIPAFHEQAMNNGKTLADSILAAADR